MEAIFDGVAPGGIEFLLEPLQVESHNYLCAIEL